MTSRALLAVALLLAPTLTAILVALVPRALVTRVAIAGALVDGCARGSPRGGRARRSRRLLCRDLDRGRRRRRPAGRRDRPRRPREPARLTRLPPDRAELARPERAAGANVLRPALRVLGDPARRAARRQPRRGVAARRGDHRRLGAPRRLQRQGPRARGRLEVPDPHLARPRGRAARDRAARRRGAGRRPRRALLAGAHHATPRARPGRSSPTSSCSPDWRPRSAGRRCTTGSPMPTPRRRRPCRRCSRPRCSPPCCSSSGAASRRSRRSSAPGRRRSS